jgi:hypothetical protein
MTKINEKLKIITRNSAGVGRQVYEYDTHLRDVLLSKSIITL